MAPLRPKGRLPRVDVQGVDIIFAPTKTVMELGKENVPTCVNHR